MPIIDHTNLLCNICTYVCVGVCECLSVSVRVCVCASASAGVQLRKYECECVRGTYNKFPDFFRMGTFIDSTHMIL